MYEGVWSRWGGSGRPAGSSVRPVSGASVASGGVS